MATWTNVPNSSIETDKPVRAIDIRALRDNPIAIAGGASGAPRIETGGINDLAVTTAKIASSSVVNSKIADGAVSTFKLESSERMNTPNVLSKTADASAGAVGTYAILGRDVSGGITLGATYAGSSLIYLTIAAGGTWDDLSTSISGRGRGGSPAGTWRALGTATSTGNDQATLFLRIS